MKDSKKTLVILSPGFARDEADTNCLPTQQTLVQSINRLYPGIRIIILAFQYPFKNDSYLWQGNRIIAFNGRNKGALHRLLLWLRVWKQLNILKKKYELAGLLSFWYGECALIGKLFGKRNGIPHFSWLFGQDARKGNIYARLAKPQSEKLIALSDFLVKEFEKNYGVIPAHTIPIGIDESLYSGIAVERDIDILGAGSLIPLKKYDLFIEVVKALKIKSPSIKAMICGDGVEREKLETMITANGLQESVVLTGEKPHAELLQLMQRSKLFLHPSSYEGFGLVCLEALYAGAQVISFCRPQDAWIRHWHFVQDVDSMTALCRELLDSDGLDHNAVLPYTITDTTHAVMRLFDQSETATS